MKWVDAVPDLEMAGVVERRGGRLDFTDEFIEEAVREAPFFIGRLSRAGDAARAWVVGVARRAPSAAREAAVSLLIDLAVTRLAELGRRLGLMDGFSESYVGAVVAAVRRVAASSAKVGLVEEALWRAARLEVRAP